jgi:hypothetical protein
MVLAIRTLVDCYFLMRSLTSHEMNQLPFRFWRILKSFYWVLTISTLYRAHIPASNYIYNMELGVKTEVKIFFQVL